jgi:hypothetical protein
MIKKEIGKEKKVFILYPNKNRDNIVIAMLVMPH